MPWRDTRQRLATAAQEHAELTLTAPIRWGASGSPQQLVRDVQRLWILSAVAQIACEQGMESVTVAQIVARAGVSKRTFYELFASREDCFLATFDEASRLASESVIEAYADEQGRWVDRVRAGLLALMAFFEEEPELARVCVAQLLKEGSPTLARRGELLQELTKIIDEGSGETPPQTQLSADTAEDVAHGVLAVIHGLLSNSDTMPSTALNTLMFMIVHPYLGLQAARSELTRPVAHVLPVRAKSHSPHGPLESLDMRLTYRRLKVLAAIAAEPGLSNSELSIRAGITDQGQISKLLARLARLEVIENTGEGQARGAPNAWRLTPRGKQIERASRRESDGAP
jgi:AcrR family transcriptional regulator